MYETRNITAKEGGGYSNNVDSSAIAPATSATKD